MTSLLPVTSAEMRATADMSLLDLLRLLRGQGYHFVTPTPATQARVLARPGRHEAHDLRDIFGWSLPFAPNLPPQPMLECLRAADALRTDGSLLRSRFRVSTLHDDLYLHSAYPTDAEDSVFFGPDSYRFVDLIAAELAARPFGLGARIADMAAARGWARSWRPKPVHRRGSS